MARRGYTVVSRHPFVRESQTLHGLFERKRVSAHADSSDRQPAGLRRTLGAFDLTLLGVGAIVGAGIFATIGTAAAGNAARPGAGPSLIISFVITALVCACTALCYAELAATVPVSGSAYTYAYATLGELCGWLIGWDLILEYAISNVAVAISWSNYFRALLHGLGLNVPLWLACDFRTARQIPGLLEQAPHIAGIPIVFNALALLIVTALTFLVVWGIRESARFNAVMVLLKIAVLIFFVAFALTVVPRATYVANWQPFFPNGWRGTLTGAAIVFFAYVGFDSLSTVAEETKDPGRTVPLGIFASLAICTVIYLGVTCVFTGIVPYSALKGQLANEQAEPLTMALQRVAPDLGWAQLVVAAGAVIAQTTALLVYQIAQPRILYAMARDGLMPRLFAVVHPRYQTPHLTIICSSLFIGLVAASASIDEMIDLTNIGTLFDFVVVCLGVPILRHKEPDRHRPFRVPGGPYLIPGFGAATCLFLMWFLPPASWWRFVGWLVAGLGIYVMYGYRHSRLGQELGRQPLTPTQRWLGGAALSLVALGLFTLPHDAGPQALLATLADVDAHGHGRTQVGSSLIGLGLAIVLLLLVVPRSLATSARLRKP